jgi:hypothetical protein
MIDWHMRGDLLEKLAPVIMEAEKSYDRPSISWRDWDAGRFAHTSLKTSEPGKLMVELCVQG